MVQVLVVWDVANEIIQYLVRYCSTSVGKICLETIHDEICCERRQL